MKAIIVSAGQGRRLLPLTTSLPKCMLPVLGDSPVLELQLRALAECGVDRATVLVGFGADIVERFLDRNPTAGLQTQTLFNPFYSLSDNLATCWLASREMDEDFILLNGDTLFESAVLRRLLEAPDAPLTVAINEKREYDDDDMKVSLNGGRRLRAVGKTLDPDTIDGESIGLMRFCSAGVMAFRDGLEAAVRQPEGLRAWYLSVVNAMAETMRIETASISGLWWGEIDSREDLTAVRVELERREKKLHARVHVPPSQERAER